MKKRLLPLLTACLCVSSLAFVGAGLTSTADAKNQALVAEKGDVNDDGVFGVSDVVLLQKWLLAVPDTHLANWKAADFCEDDILNVFDLCLMKKALIEDKTWQNSEQISDSIDVFTLTPSKDGVAEIIGSVPESIYKDDELYNVTPDEITEKYGFTVYKHTMDYESFLEYNGKIYPIAVGWGGFGTTSFAVTDMDSNGMPELYYTYGWGSGMHRSEIAYFDFATLSEKHFIYDHPNEDIVFICEDGRLKFYSATYQKDFSAQPDKLLGDIIYRDKMVRFALTPEEAENELSNLCTMNQDAIENVTVTAYPSDETVELTREQITELQNLLKDIKLTERDDSYNEYNGQWMQFDITTGYGATTSLAVYNPFFIIDRIGYQADYDALQALNVFGNSVISGADINEVSPTTTAKVTITAIEGNTLIVTPINGSPNKISLSVKEIDSDIEPKIGMQLEVVYDGSIMETFPAQFSGITNVTVVPNTPLPDKGTLMNDLEYEIGETSYYDSQYAERGYYTSSVDNKVQYIISSGMHSTGGYDIKITNIDVLDIGKVILTVEETSPALDETVTTALTYPTCTITFSQELPDGIIIKNSSGYKYACLDEKSDSNEASLSGKIFAYEKEGWGGYCTISFNENGRFLYYPGKLCSYMGGGDWKIEGDTVVLAMEDKTIRLKIDGDTLVYTAEDSDEFPYMTDIKDGEKFDIYKPEITSDMLRLKSQYTDYGLGDTKVQLELTANELPEFCFVDEVKLYDEDDNFIGTMTPYTDVDMWGYQFDCHVTEECEKTYYTLTTMRCGSSILPDPVRSEWTVFFREVPAP